MDPNLPFWEHLSEDGRALLQHEMVLKDFGAGKAVLYKGQSVSGVYLVVRGRLRIYHLSADGIEATLYSLAAGETCVLALNSLFNDLLYPAWVESEEDSTVAVISGDTFRRLFAQEASVRDIIVQALATMVFGLMAQLSQVHAYKLDGRLVHLLLTRATSDGLVHMTQQQIAQHLGTSREVIARLMSQFAGTGCIKTARGIIQIIDPCALGKISVEVG